MPLKKLEYWILAQVGLEVVLVLVLLFFLVKIRAMSKLLQASREAEQSATGELAQLSEQLALLESKRLALEETLSLLSEKAAALIEQSSSRRAGNYGTYPSSSSGPRGAPLRLQVEDLHNQGFSPAEIAHRLGLHPTEVKMALDLARLKVEQP